MHLSFSPRHFFSLKTLENAAYQKKDWSEFVTFYKAWTYSVYVLYNEIEQLTNMGLYEKTQ